MRWPGARPARARTPSGIVDGLFVIAVQPKGVVAVNLVGTVDLDKLRKLEGNLGIPRINIKGVEIKTKKQNVTVTTGKP